MHINLTAVGGVNQAVAVGMPLAEPFVARVTDDSGKPLAGVVVGFDVNACVEFPEPPPGAPGCPDPALYGHFAQTSSSLVTDLNGEAQAPAFVAGALPGNYSVFVSYFPWDQTYNGFTLTDIPFSQSNLFQITQLDVEQGAGGLVTTPALSAPGAALFGAALALLGALAVRKRRAARRRP